MEIPKAVILSSTQSTAVAVKKQLEQMFSDLITFENFDFQTLQQLPSKIHNGFVLVTSGHIYEQASQFLSEGTETLIANRVINVDTLDELYELPKGTDVLLVNNLEETTLESIEQLQAIGFGHLQYHPYYPSISQYKKNCPCVISFDEMHLIPDGDYEKVINLGSRPIDLSTIIAIAVHFDVYDRVKTILSPMFLKPSLELSKKVYKQLKTNNYLRDKQTFILNMFEAGIVVLDHEMKLDFANAKARKTLNLDSKDTFYLDQIITRIQTESKFFINIQNNSYHVEVSSYNFDQLKEYILTIEGTQKIESIEKNYRMYSHQKGFVADYTFDKILHHSSLMEIAVLKAKQFAQSQSNILIEGESGSGKELFAQAIHNHSTRRNNPFVAVNFAALNETLCESELFGYEEGAFTGARKGGKKGLFEAAHQGTIFLDEIGDAPISIQKKILRVIQERRVMPIGSNQLVPVDVRIISATNQNLWHMVTDKTFRQDLYYRLRVLPLYIHPLRERRKDILPLFLHFLKRSFDVKEEYILAIKQSQEIIDILMAHEWPGNIRELRNVAEYLSHFISFNVDWAMELRNILSSSQPSSGESYPDIIKKLEKSGCINDYLLLLKALERPPYVFGRSDLQKELKQVSESTIKRYLADMKNLGLIQSKSGYGSYLVDAGKKLLRSMENASLS